MLQLGLMQLIAVSQVNGYPQYQYEYGLPNFSIGSENGLETYLGTKDDNIHQEFSNSVLFSTQPIFIQLAGGKLWLSM